MSRKSCGSEVGSTIGALAPMRKLRIAFTFLTCGMLAFVLQPATAMGSRKAPSFKLRDLENSQVLLDEVLKRGPALIVFWATCCSNTHPLMVHLDSLQQRYSETGFSVLAIAVDDNKSASRVRPWVLARRLTYPVLPDPTGEVMRRYHVKTIPHCFLVDQQGFIVSDHAGFLPGDEQAHEREIRGLLGIENEEQ